MDHQDEIINHNRIWVLPFTWIKLAVKQRVVYHLHDLHVSIDPQVVEERGQVFLHLDGVVFHLSHGEDAHGALPPHLRQTHSVKHGLRHSGSTATAASHTLCCLSRKGSSISIPPSWTIHHTSMKPSVHGSLLLGNREMFLGTSRAKWAVVVTRTVSKWGERDEWGLPVQRKTFWCHTNENPSSYTSMTILK